MAMDSTDFKRLSHGFGRDLHDVKQSLYFALNGELSEPERAEAVAAGEKKLKDYAQLLQQLEGTKKDQVTRQFAESVEEISKTLAQLAGSKN